MKNSEIKKEAQILISKMEEKYGDDFNYMLTETDEAIAFTDDEKVLEKAKELVRSGE